MEHQDIMPLVHHGWTAPAQTTDVAKIITAKFYNLRKVLREWQSNLSCLKVAIANVKLTLSFLLYLE